MRIHAARGLRVIFALLPLAATFSSAQGQAVADHEKAAQQYLQQRRPELARKEFEAIVAADPNNLNAQTNLGVLSYFAGDFETAEQHLRAALQMNPALPRQQALLGFSERRNGKAEEARKDLLAALPSLPDPKLRKQTGLELVELDTQLHDLPAAAAVLNQLRAAAPTDPEILYAAYRTYSDLAGESMLELSVAAPESPQVHQAMAHEFVRERDNPRAIANLRQALQADPHLPGAHFELGELLRSAPEAALKDEAPQQYLHALEDNPGDATTLVRLGDIAADKGNHDEAMGRYGKALDLQPENNEAKIGLAHVLVDQGHTDQALSLLQAVVQSDPTNQLAHYRLSSVYRRLHRPEDAKREVTEYEHLKAVREKLRSIYDALRLNPAMNAAPRE